LGPATTGRVYVTEAVSLLFVVSITVTANETVSTVAGVPANDNVLPPELATVRPSPFGTLT
jgi:hypothetical protein